MYYEMHATKFTAADLRQSIWSHMSVSASGVLLLVLRRTMEGCPANAAKDVMFELKQACDSLCMLVDSALNLNKALPCQQAWHQPYVLLHAHGLTDS